MVRSVNITGKRFGRLSVLGRGPNQRGRIMWRCQCDCGGECIVRGTALTTGNSKSCGCAIREAMSRTGKANATHGESHTVEYRAWARMIHRCYNETDIKFHLYGGRGIRVCDRWLESYEAFQADMGRKPTPRHSLDRKESDGNYEPSNCRWATSSEQNKNRRPFTRNSKVAHHGCA